ncbi:longevity assurance proteins LAG1/LAC1 [Coemansia reversa NRRL 1564]|uniref:Longevity assurance proteins LAG1/LAC1 n=1 Tax=Coemansia reversa (strain ATCC 12441 / NRRL 1564) TaxID=763665 RepID=A0A2G5BIX2_COERN|nr:longevity assurance proteins LAG1/LAC1 [Coemansia reversa NRRL 1564]|eukprot:PIA18931.1 longevity assurance proteins LAG1/LAC1 [Coemansia reversa NRRL 1564]
MIPSDPEGRYYRGARDLYFILHWTVVFTYIRVIVMNRLLVPFARWYGVKSARKLTRFGEQGWLTIYYTLSNSAGLYVMYNGPHWMNTKGFWEGYPEGHRQMTALMKSYYLVQMGFWFQQIFVLMIEERRKDFVAMFIHHVVTYNLLGWSLYMNFTRIGNAILCCMDSSDIFLSGTKCLRYLKMDKLSVVGFTTFMLSWIYTRHYLYIKIMLSIIYESRQYISDDIWDPAKGAYYNANVQLAFTILLGILQLLLIYWFALVLRIVYRIIFLGNLEDNRSDSEDDGDDQEGTCVPDNSNGKNKRIRLIKSKNKVE